MALCEPFGGPFASYGECSARGASRPSRGATWGPDFSISSATVRTAPKLGGWVPLCKTIKRGSVWDPKSPAPVSGHFTAQNGPIGPGTDNGPKQAKISPKRPKTILKPPVRWSLPTGLNSPSMTNDVPMERFGPWETQHRAYHGPCGAILPSPNPILGSCGPKP